MSSRNYLLAVHRAIPKSAVLCSMSRPSSRSTPAAPRPPCHRLCPFRSLLWCQSQSLVTASLFLAFPAQPVPGIPPPPLPRSRALGSPPHRLPPESVSPPLAGPRTPTAWRSGGGGGGGLRRGGPGASPFFPHVADAWGREVAGAGGGPARGSSASPPRARRVPGRMGCTVSLVCCEALEPLPSCGPQPPGTPPGPARPERCEPGGAAPVQRRRLLLQVGSCGPGTGSGHGRARSIWNSKESR